MSTHLRDLCLGRLVGIVAVVFAVQTNFVSPASVQASDKSFDVRDLRGAYAGLVTGKIGTSDAASLARIVADGEGNLTLEQTRNVGGTTSCTGVRECTYVIQPGGFGTVTCPPFFPPAPCVGSGNTATFEILLSENGEQFDAFLAQGTNVLSGHFSRQ